LRTYEGVSAGVIIATSETATAEFEKARVALEKELRIPVRLILRRGLVRLLIAHLPGIVADTEEDSGGA
jgi:hypothetical protein